MNNIPPSPSQNTCTPSISVNFPMAKMPRMDNKCHALAINLSKKRVFPKPPLILLWSSFLLRNPVDSFGPSLSLSDKCVRSVFQVSLVTLPPIFRTLTFPLRDINFHDLKQLHFASQKLRKPRFGSERTR